MTKLKLINRIGEVWSARSPPPAADALPSFLSHPAGKAELCRKSISACDQLRVPFGSSTGELPIRTFTPEPELCLEFVTLCVKKRVPRRSVAVWEIQPSANLIYKSDVFALLRSIRMRILWVSLLYCLGLSGKGEFIYIFNLNLIFKFGEWAGSTFTI